MKNFISVSTVHSQVGKMFHKEDHYDNPQCI